MKRVKQFFILFHVRKWCFVSKSALMTEVHTDQWIIKDIASMFICVCSSLFLSLQPSLFQCLSDVMAHFVFVCFLDCVLRLCLWTVSAGVVRLCTVCLMGTGMSRCPTSCSARWTMCWLKNYTRPKAKRTTWPTLSLSCKGTWQNHVHQLSSLVVNHSNFI